MYFNEQPMSVYPEEEVRNFRATALMFPNSHYDPVAASRLFNEYVEQYVMTGDYDFDGIMLNEHHNAPFCMQAKANIMASVLAAMTKRVKLVMLGNPLPLAENPIRLAEELAMIDSISKGRLVSDFVRGGGTEQLTAGGNPAGYHSPSQRQMFVKMVAGRPEAAWATGYAAPFEQQVADSASSAERPRRSCAS
jgi:alkanesulfonate monooxygenase SsuD/methylene tetrahydromethanopterin reductase-like flavin-dependent oxidoreductase (luciferase family)